jgi:hypothetical protein
MEYPPPCKFCGQLAIVRVALPEGCLCYPEDREQALCPQHLDRASPLGEMFVLEDYYTRKDS